MLYDNKHGRTRSISLCSYAAPDMQYYDIEVLTSNKARLLPCASRGHNQGRSVSDVSTTRLRNLRHDSNTTTIV